MSYRRPVKANPRHCGSNCHLCHLRRLELSWAEITVFSLILLGMTCREISIMLKKAHGTVRHQAYAVEVKLGCDNILGVFLWGVHHGMIDYAPQPAPEPEAIESESKADAPYLTRVEFSTVVASILLSIGKDPAQFGL